MVKQPLTAKLPINRPRQQLPEEIIGDLMEAVRNGFYPGDARWFAQKNDIKRMVLTWPASWLFQRGVTLKPERYKAILLAVFMDIKRMGDTASVKYWPRYLRHCLQQHFKHHGDEIYDEAKAVRNQVENALMACQKAADAARGNDPVADLALVHRALTAGHNRKRRPSAAKEQLTLL